MSDGMKRTYLFTKMVSAKTEEDLKDLTNEIITELQENQQLKARVARLERQLAAHIHIKKVGLIGATEEDFRALDDSEKILNESEKQSLAAIQAEAVEDMVITMGKKHGGVGSYSFQPLSHKDILEYAQQLRDKEG